MANQTADTAAAMLVAVRSAQLSKQPLAVGLADALDEFVDRTADECDSRKIPLFTTSAIPTMPEPSTLPDVVLVTAVALNLVLTLPTLVFIWRNLK